APSDQNQIIEGVKKAEAKTDFESLAAIQANPQLQQSQKQAFQSYYALGIPSPADQAKEPAQNVYSFGELRGGRAGDKPAAQPMDGLAQKDPSAGASVNGTLRDVPLHVGKPLQQGTETGVAQNSTAAAER